MNPIWIMFLVGLMGTIRALIVTTRNEKFANSEEGQTAMDETKAYAESVISADERLVLYDYSIGMRACVVVTDQKIYYKQKKRNGNLIFETRYGEITKCSFLNYKAQKVKSDNLIENIEIKTDHGKCFLTQFPRIQEIAQELAIHGFEKTSLFGF